MLKLGRIIEGPPKQKGKIRNPDIFALGGGSKMGIESSFVCQSRKANPLLEELESSNLADLLRDHPNKR
jgi:hypothetical protein